MTNLYNCWIVTLTWSQELQRAILIPAAATVHKLADLMGAELTIPWIHTWAWQIYRLSCVCLSICLSTIYLLSVCANLSPIYHLSECANLSSIYHLCVCANLSPIYHLSVCANVSLIYRYRLSHSVYLSVADLQSLCVSICRLFTVSVLSICH